MNRAILLTATLALAGSLMAQTGAIPSPPPAQQATPAPKATPAPQAAPAVPAVPAAPAPAPKPRVKTYRNVTTPGGSYLGVDVRTVTVDRARELKLKSDRGVEITMVDQDGPAGKAGLEENDVVVSFNGQAVQSADQLRKLIVNTKPGESISLGIVRDGQPQTIRATLANRAKMYSYGGPGPMHVEVPPIHVRIPDIDIPAFVLSTASRRSGLTVENLSPQLGEYFGVKDGQGVLVRSVDKGSKAEAAGLRAGDVILRVDNERVSDAGDWARLLRHHDGGSVKLGILRDRREQTLSLALPEASSENSFYVPGPDMEQLRMQLQRLGPELGQQQAEIQARIAREMAAHQKEIEQAMREAQRNIERSMRDMQLDKDEALRDAQREKEHALRDAQRAKERALRDAEREKERAKKKQNDDEN
jgi:serine protease Do